MRLTPDLKKLMLQPVHCIGYLAAAHGNFSLDHNEYDNKWYFQKNFSRDYFAGIATDNISSWKHNRKFEFKETEFSGVIVKIDRVLVSTTLGVYKRDYRGDLFACDFAPSKGDGCTLIAATVFYRNGCKRIVPLDCIQESAEFSNGKETKDLMKKLESLIDNQSKNTITFHDDGRIEIENLYYNLVPESTELLELKRYLVLDVRNRTARFYAEAGNECFNIGDEEYEQIMSAMKEQMKEECGFVPDLSYGENNFDRLVNFARFPFAPELNELCNEKVLGPTYCEIEEELKRSSDGIKKFIQYTGLPYTPKINRLFLQGHRTFLEYLNIWSMGFRDEKVIEKLMDADSQKIFAASCPYTMYPALEGDIGFLFQFYDEKTVAKLMKGRFSSERGCYTTSDALHYMILLNEGGNLTQNVIDKIGNEGFTAYNHNLLMRIFRETQPAEEEHFENKNISYSDEEKSLEWENGGYKFCLPEDTNRLVDIGSKMNICVGHLYRDKAVNKECTIVFAKKADEYELCIEVHKHNERFRLVQRSAFNNQDPHGNDLLIFKQWCRVKGVS